MATTKKKTTTKRKRKTTRGVTFSWKRLLGLDQIKRNIAKQTGIPMTKAGVERKIGSAVIALIVGLFTKKSDKKEKQEEENPIDENLRL
ncbi:MAG: hypothetical protein IJ665_08410 [Phocaeicola sp.]|nr:hypothetical protein [Phocaeicola sp.]